MLSNLYQEYIDKVFGKGKDEDPDYTKMMISAMDLYESGKHHEANKLVNKLGPDQFSNPILCILMARNAEAWLAKKDFVIPNEDNFIKKDRLNFFLEAQRTLRMEELDLLAKIPEKMKRANQFPSKALEKTYLHLHTMRQYSTYFFLKYSAEKPGGPDFRHYWKEGRFQKFNNYTNVDPFYVALCPPHHIWTRYVYDGQIFEMDKSGKVTSRPLEPGDLKKKIVEPEMPAFLQGK